jgi:hypothetical protein
MLKVCLKGRCKSVELISVNGEPSRCAIQVSLMKTSPLSTVVVTLSFSFPQSSPPF